LPGKKEGTVTTNPLDQSNPIIRCRSLELGYGPDTILQDVNIDVPAGVFLPFVGPNGAGKTTLLRAILGLLEPRSGKIETPFHDNPPGYVSQQKAIDPLYPVSVLDIVLMGAYRQAGWHGRTNRTGIRNEAMELLKRFGMAGHCHKTFSQLSGGMRQKTMVARALVGGAQVLVMDEPTTELDHRAQGELLDLLHDAVHSDGRTVLLVHHGLGMIMHKAEYVCLVQNGAANIVPIEEARF